MNYQIELTPARRFNGSPWVGQGCSFMAYEGQRIGESRVPSCEAARWLKDNVGATDTDTLVTLRDGVPCIRGAIGWLAQRTVEENDKVSPRWVKYRPYVAPAGSPWTAHRGSEVASQAAENELEVVS